VTALEKKVSNEIVEAERHPYDEYLRWDRLPHVWCSGCGLGSLTSCFIHAVEQSSIDKKKLCIVSGIGCSGRISGYMNFDVFHTTHGRAIPFAIGLKLANPELKVVVISGDGDLFAIGGNHIIHAARRNADITVICANNFLYGMTGGQLGPTTPIDALTSTSPYGNVEPAFNICDLIASSGAVYVARWTSLDIRRLQKSIQEALNKRGFSFIEVIIPCPTLFGRRNKFDDTLKMMEYFKAHSVVKHGVSTTEIAINLGEDIIVGKFVDIQDRPTILDRLANIKAKIHK